MGWGCSSLYNTWVHLCVQDLELHPSTAINTNKILRGSAQAKVRVLGCLKFFPTSTHVLPLTPFPKNLVSCVLQQTPGTEWMPWTGTAPTTVSPEQSIPSC